MAGPALDRAGSRSADDRGCCDPPADPPQDSREVQATWTRATRCCGGATSSQPEWKHAPMTQSGEGEASEFARLARALGEAKGFEAQLELLVSEAVRLVPCRWASVAVSARLSAHPARLSTSSDLELGTTISRIAARAGTSTGI